MAEIIKNLSFKTPLGSVDEFVARYAARVSDWTLNLEVKEPYPVGTIIRFEFRLQNGERVLFGEGKITNPPVESIIRKGFYTLPLKILKLSKESQSIFFRMIRIHSAQSAAASPPPEIDRPAIEKTPPWAQPFGPDKQYPVATEFQNKPPLPVAVGKAKPDGTYTHIKAYRKENLGAPIERKARVEKPIPRPESGPKGHPILVSHSQTDQLDLEREIDLTIEGIIIREDEAADNLDSSSLMAEPGSQYQENKAAALSQRLKDFRQILKVMSPFDTQSEEKAPKREEGPPAMKEASAQEASLDFEPDGAILDFSEKPPQLDLEGKKDAAETSLNTLNLMADIHEILKTQPAPSDVPKSAPLTVDPLNDEDKRSIEDLIKELIDEIKDPPPEGKK